MMKLLYESILLEYLLKTSGLRHWWAAALTFFLSNFKHSNFQTCSNHFILRILK